MQSQEDNLSKLTVKEGIMSVDNITSGLRDWKLNLESLGLTQQTFGWSIFG